MAKSGKGSQWERDICRVLSNWWTDDKDDSVFWRTSQSGGRMTSRAKAGKSTKHHCGDISSVDPIGFPLTETITFELKRGYPKADPIATIDKPKKAAVQQFESFLDQAITSAELAKTPYWAILHKRDKRDPLIYVPHTLLMDLMRITPLRMEEMGRRASFFIQIRLKEVPTAVNFWCFRFNRFLGEVSRSSIISLHERNKK